MKIGDIKIKITDEMKLAYIESLKDEARTLNEQLNKIREEADAIETIRLSLNERLNCLCEAIRKLSQLAGHAK